MTQVRNSRHAVQYVVLGGVTAVAMSAALPLSARASVVEPGGVVESFDTTLADRPDLGGAVIRSGHFDLQFDAFPMGVYSQVVRDIGGALTFYYRLENMSAPGRTLAIDNVTIGGFQGFSTDVANLLDTAGQTAPPAALRNADGAAVIFDFDEAESRLTPGGESFTFVVKTNATHFDMTSTAGVRAFATDTPDGPPPGLPQLATVQLFGPSNGVVAVPLPNAAAAVVPVAGALGLYALVKQRRSRRQA